jgi:hypothetical protein
MFVKKNPKLPRILPHAIAFLSAYLGFWLQLMVAKSILPEAGGLPIVWIVSVLLFQTLVLISYLYGTSLELLNIKVGKNIGLIIHTIVLTLACIMVLPLGKPIWEPSHDSSPVIGVLTSLWEAIGIIFLLLSANSLLMTNYIKRQYGEHDEGTNKAYAIFATSNAGSLLGLISYPLFIEPTTKLATQYYAWSGIFILIVVSYVIICLSTRNIIPHKKGIEPKIEKSQSDRDNKKIISALRIFLLTATSCFIFLCATTYFSISLFPMPLIWVLPLGAYLMAWIVAFNPNKEKTANNQKRALYGAGLLVLNALPLPFVIILPINIAIVYLICLGIHSRVYELKSGVESSFGASTYYILIAVGGIAGNILSLLLINKFETIWVYLLGCLIGLMLLPPRKLLELKTNLSNNNKPPIDPKIITRCYKYTMLTLILCGYWGITLEKSATREEEEGSDTRTRLFRSQNTLGNLIVEEVKKETPEGLLSRRSMTINNILQGDEIGGRGNVTYGYTKLKSYLRNKILRNTEEPKRWLALGLGVGTVASVGKKGDTIRVAEINPDVIKAAKEYFSYIERSKANIDIALGDGRKILNQANDNSIDILICDAYAGGSIPQHMMSKEFFEIAKRKITEDGVIAVHISHATLNLKPILASIGNKLSMDTWYSDSIHTENDEASKSWWILFTKEGAIEPTKKENLKEIGFTKISISDSNAEKYLWTDDFSSVIRALPMPFEEEVILKE